MRLFEGVKANVTASQAAAYCGFAPNRSKMICCPFHNDKHPSMKVDRRYYCFGCGEHGDAIDFVAKYYDLSLKDLMLLTSCHLTGVEIVDFYLLCATHLKQRYIFWKMKQNPVLTLNRCGRR